MKEFFDFQVAAKAGPLKHKTVNLIGAIFLILLCGCAEKPTVNDWIYSAGDVIDYKKIRTEDRKNKVKSEMDK